jgi:hypothetical protein
MACQRSLILYYDVQDALLAGGEVNPGNGSLGIQLQNAKLKTWKASLFRFHSFHDVSFFSDVVIALKLR